MPMYLEFKVYMPARTRVGGETEGKLSKLNKEYNQVRLVAYSFIH